MRAHFTIQFWLTSLLSTTLVACSGAGNSTTAPAITSRTANVSTQVWNTAAFTASRTAPLSYRWQKNGTPIAAVTAASYTIPARAIGDSASTYTVLVSDSAGSGTTLGTTAIASSDVATFKNDIPRSGLNAAGTISTLANVNATSFGLLPNVMLDGKVDVQPLYLSQVPIAGVAHDVAYVATVHGSVYAIDVDSGAPLWQMSVLAAGETSSDTHGCTQLTPEIGITATPVIDRTAGPHGVLYVVGMSIDKSSNYHQRLHAVDITTGAEMFNGPAEITATARNAAGVTTFEPGQYEERAALLLANGQIYTSCTSHCGAAR